MTQVKSGSSMDYISLT